MKDIQDNIMMNMAIKNTEEESRFSFDSLTDKQFAERTLARFKRYKKIHEQGEGL